MELDPETLNKYFPYYLTEESRKKLLEELEAFDQSKKVKIFLNDYNNDYKENLLQGDGWRGFELYVFETGKKQTVKGIVISNSCDIDSANIREISTKVAFAPLVKLSAFKNLLDNSSIETNRVEAKIKAIKEQKTSNIFFIPADGPIEEDYIVRFDDIHSMPIKFHQTNPEREKLFTLSMLGFYLFVLKLSVHFCRLQEDVAR